MNFSFHLLGPSACFDWRLLAADPIGRVGPARYIGWSMSASSAPPGCCCFDLPMKLFFIGDCLTFFLLCDGLGLACFRLSPLCLPFDDCLTDPSGVSSSRPLLRLSLYNLDPSRSSFCFLIFLICFFLDCIDWSIRD